MTVDWKDSSITEEQLMTGRVFVTLEGRRNDGPERVSVGRIDHQHESEFWTQLTPEQADRLGLELIRLASYARAEADDPALDDESEDGAE